MRLLDQEEVDKRDDNGRGPVDTPGHRESMTIRTSGTDDHSLMSVGCRTGGREGGIELAREEDNWRDLGPISSRDAVRVCQGGRPRC